jgi:phage N-6-adenine-methyltransferase
MDSTGFYSSSTALSSLDETWATPAKFFADLNKEFNFVIDAAAVQSSALCDFWYGPDHPDLYMRDAFQRNWALDANGGNIFLNPPYGRTIKDWMRKADFESKRGATVVCLVPSRTDTIWFQDYCLDKEVRFIRGRLKFNDGVNPAPFPSAVVVMNGQQEIAG